MRMRLSASCVLGAAVLALAPSAASKEFRTIALVGADGNSLSIAATPSLIDSFFDAASPHNGGTLPPRASPSGGYVALYVLTLGGVPGIPGRYYPKGGVACFSWDATISRGTCRRASRDLTLLLRPAAGLPRRTGSPTTIRRLSRTDRPVAVRNLFVAFEMAFAQTRLSRSASVPRTCIAFRATWRGPQAPLRPERFCLSTAGVHADGRLYPLGAGIFRLARLNP